MIAKIAVAAANFAIDKPYSYYVPENLTVRPGQRVMQIPQPLHRSPSSLGKAVISAPTVMAF